MWSLRGERTPGSGSLSLLSGPFTHFKMRPKGLFLLQTLHFVFANFKLKQSLHRVRSTDPECPAGTCIPVKLWDGPIQSQVTLTPSPPPLRPSSAHPACRTLWNLGGGVRCTPPTRSPGPPSAAHLQTPGEHLCFCRKAAQPPVPGPESRSETLARRASLCEDKHGHRLIPGSKGI